MNNIPTLAERYEHKIAAFKKFSPRDQEIMLVVFDNLIAILFEARVKDAAERSSPPRSFYSNN